MLDLSVSRPGVMVVCLTCGGSWATWAYTECPACEAIRAKAAALAHYMRFLEAIGARHIARYPAAPPPMEAAGWWARQRHGDRQRAAASAAYAGLAREVHDWAAWAHYETRASGPHGTRDMIAYEAIWACSLSGGRGCAMAEEVREAARLAVTFIAEPPPPAATGGDFMGLGKGTGRVRVPPGSVARRGGGECSYLIFYDHAGTPLAAYTTRADGPEVGVVSIASPRAEQHFAAYHYPIQAVTPTADEHARTTIFGGA